MIDWLTKFYKCSREFALSIATKLVEFGAITSHDGV
jgi:hypothetical protein